MVSIEQSQEARLRPGRPLYATEPEVVSGTLNISQIP